MVRSCGHHRKRSRSRSVTPDHKRSKSSRDYEKDRLRRRSRSRDRLRRSRSRDRKKEKKISESRVRSKPLKLKRRSRSRTRSRSKSKDKTTKKDDKKDVKIEDEPFDPTNLDKVAGKDEEEEWVVTDVIEDQTIEDNGNLEEEYDYEADEDDQYSHTSTHNTSHHSSPDTSNRQTEEISVSNEMKESQISSNKEEGDGGEPISDKPKSESMVEMNSSNKKEDLSLRDESRKENIKDVVLNLKETSSSHKEKLKLYSAKYEAEKLNLKSRSFNWSHVDSQRSEELVRLTKDHIKQSIKLDKELHELRMKHEIARHRAELEVIKVQLDYWKNKH